MFVEDIRSYLLNYSNHHTTDSLKVAKYFYKDHKNLIRRINSILKNGVISENNFELAECKDSIKYYNPLLINPNTLLCWLKGTS